MLQFWEFSTSESSPTLPIQQHAKTYICSYLCVPFSFSFFLSIFIILFHRLRAASTEWLGSIVIFGICLCLILEMPGHKRIIYFIFLSLIAGSQRQSNIWSSSHDRHCWQSNILPANGCGSWPCAEQVSSDVQVYFTCSFYLFIYGRKF